MEKLRVGLFCTGVFRRKSYARNLCLARGLTKLGCEVTLFICHDRFRFERKLIDGVHLILTPELLPYRLRKGGLGPIDTLARLVCSLPMRFDLVHADEGLRPASGFPGHVYAHLRKVPYVCDWWDWVGHGGLLDYRSKVYQYTLGAMDNYFEVWDKLHAAGVVTISAVLRERAINLGIPPERTTVIHGGADVWQESYQEPADFRREMGWDLDAPIMGFAGMGPHEYETIVPFLECVPELRRRFPKFIWFSTGDAMPDSVRRQYGIGTEYVDVGWLDYRKYQRCLAAADVLLLLLSQSVPDAARWPNKLGDYLAAGRPIVGSAVGELDVFAKRYPDSVQLVGPSSEEVCEGVSAMLESPSRRHKMGLINLDVARSEYSWDHKAEELLSFYRDVLAMGPP